MQEPPPDSESCVAQTYRGRPETSPLVGRDSERALVANVLDDAIGGRGAFILIEGAAGIGKSRLARHAAAIAVERGFTVFGGASSMDERGTAYAPFIDGLRSLRILEQGREPPAARALYEVLAGPLPDGEELDSSNAVLRIDRRRVLEPMLRYIDQTGTPRVISDAAGTVVKGLQYDSYGNLLSDSNPSFTLAIGYAGGIADGATGLVRFGFRDYDAAAGRWTSRDPAMYQGSSLNLYAYVNGDPVNAVDPSGLWSFTIGGSLYEGIGGGASFTFGTGGFKVCAEGGVGVGGGLELGFSSDGKVDPTLTASLVVEASVKVGVGEGIGVLRTRAQVRRSVHPWLGQGGACHRRRSGGLARFGHVRW